MMIDWGQEGGGGCWSENCVCDNDDSDAPPYPGTYDSLGMSLSGATPSGVFCLEVSYVEGTGKKT